MPYGVTETGFNRATYADLLAEVKAQLRAKIDSRLTLDEKDALGQITAIFCDRLAEAWEALEAAYHGFDPKAAVGFQAVALAALTGTKRRLAGPGRVIASVTFDQPGTYAAGALVAHETGAPANRWTNVDPIVVSAPGVVVATFESEGTGSTVYVGASRLTEIAASVYGWTGITNATESSYGTDTETIEELRLRRERELQQSGSSTVGALAAAVGNVDGVIEAVCEENTTDEIVGYLPPRSFMLIVWDGEIPVATDNAIAQAIYENRPAGMPSIGNDSGTATDATTGQAFTERFRRASADACSVSVTIEASPAVSVDAVKAAIVAAFEDDRRIGTDVKAARLAAAPFTVAGVTDVTAFVLSGPVKVGSNVIVGPYSRATLDPDDITVSGDVE